MLRCWHLVRILVRTDHPCLGVGCHIDTSEYFSMPQNTLNLQIFDFSSFTVLVLKICQNRTVRNRKPDGLVFSALPNLVMNTCPLVFWLSLRIKRHFRPNLTSGRCSWCFISHFCAKGDNTIIGRFLTQASYQTLGQYLSK
jgi:hypothetical protein